MSEPFIGEIRLLPFNFAPLGWAFCQGQLLSIAQNTALFSLLGTTYGGNGQTNFRLPDLRGRVAVSSGQGPGLSDYQLGETGGEENHTLITNELPTHNHAVACNGEDSNSANPTSHFPASQTTGYSTASTASMNAGVIGATGGSQPHNNVQPYLTFNYCIALQGIFPPRP